MISKNTNQLRCLDNIQSLTDVDVPKTYPYPKLLNQLSFHKLFSGLSNVSTDTDNQCLDLGFLELHQVIEVCTGITLQTRLSQFSHKTPFPSYFFDPNHISPCTFRIPLQFFTRKKIFVIDLSQFLCFLFMF